MERFFSYTIPMRRLSGVIALPHNDKVMARKTIARQRKVKVEDVKFLYIMDKGFRL